MVATNIYITHLNLTIYEKILIIFNYIYHVNVSKDHNNPKSLNNLFVNALRMHIYIYILNKESFVHQVLHMKERGASGHVFLQTIIFTVIKLIIWNYLADTDQVIQTFS